ncbi:glycosyltransferase family 4 protein [Belliella marina]|uniref:Glycosyltransferase family 4 protein n=1 Tax=Belliella marina TaxID=1644146 RepID=A0ABW4VT03_9BACT
MVKPKALIVVPSFQSFIVQDIQLLSEHYELIINHYNWKKKELAPIYLIRQLFHLLVSISQCKFILIHFGGYWSFLPTLLGKIFSKPSYIVLHGTDCAAIPELNYGSLRIPLLKWFCKKSYEWATMLLPVSNSLVFSQNKFNNPNSTITNGFQYHFPNLNTPHTVIPNGFDIDFWKPGENVRKGQHTFISVLSKEQFILKGGDLIVQLGEKFKDYTFLIAGMEKPENLSTTKNVYFLGKLPPERLRSYYQKANFYFQLSIFEGFGCALCEAMLCGCIPLGSDVNEIPVIIGNTGLILKSRKIAELESEVNKLLNFNIEQNTDQTPRNRITKLYNLENRKKMLIKTLSNN